MIRRIIIIGIGLILSFSLSGSNPLPELEAYKNEVKLLPIDSLCSPEIDDLENCIYNLFSDSWNHLYVNPYNVNVDSVFSSVDSINIDFSTFTYPLPTHYRVTDNFGPRRTRYHYGIDLKVYVGDTINTILGGVVRVAKREKNYGNYIVIRHYNGVESVYGHLSKILVEPNQVVESGEIIGYGGNTGRSTGSHLHFELRYKGSPINPRDIICFENLCAKSDTLCLKKDNFSYKAKAKALTTNIWVVRSGDTLGRIAQRTGTSISRLCALNKITRTSVLNLKQRIRY